MAAKERRHSFRMLLIGFLVPALVGIVLGVLSVLLGVV